MSDLTGFIDPLTGKFDLSKYAVAKVGNKRTSLSLRSGSSSRGLTEAVQVPKVRCTIN
jgi:hypothetical protein